MAFDTEAPTATPGVQGATGGWNAPLYAQNPDGSAAVPPDAVTQVPVPQSPPNIPQPPSVESSVMPQQQHGAIRNLLTRMAYGAGQAALQVAGLPTDFDIQRQNFLQNLEQSKANLNQAQTQIAQRQLDQYDTVPWQDSNGQWHMVQRRDLGGLLKTQETGQFNVQKQTEANKPKLQANEIQAAHYGYKVINGQPVARTYEDLSPVQQSVIDLANAKSKEDLASAQKKLRDSVNGAGSAAGDKRTDASYKYNNDQLNNIAKPITDLSARLGRLQDTLRAGSPQADALVAPELLTVMAGGQGSGLRMNEAEIARIVGGRSQWETLKASINKWSLDPSTANSITTAQRQQIRALTNHVESKLLSKQAILENARDQIAQTNDIGQHRQIVNNARRQILAIDSGASQGVPSGSTAPPSGGQSNTGGGFFEGFGGKPR